ncbi:MAG TPA: acyltransferase family protein, partial [Sphingomonas sp.]|nr:acyltransferase family protein [Sphingomonas sp.]
MAGDKHAYRAEIDGLRALAVLSILIFHLRSTVLPGGYLGVDIFFVISGYIITRLIQPDVESGRFSIANFYMRRVRRIIPAMAVMLLATLVGGLLILLPYDLVDLGKATIATILFNANHYSLVGAGYFARSSDLKPLNHMWSLGIEEQFYLVFPWVLVALNRLRARARMIVLAGLVAASMAAFLISFRLGASEYAFFLLPTRAWELGAGAILSLLADRPKGSLTGSAIGLMLVLFALVSNLTLADGWLHPAVPAVAGAMALIRFLDPRHAIGRLFTLRPVRFVGLSSFSIYLWHWPLIAFARYWLIRDPNVIEMIVLAAATLGLASLSWLYVEQRYRARAIPFPAVARFCGVTIGATVAIAAVTIVFDGLPQRMRPDADRIAAAVDSHYRCSIFDYVPVHGSRGCRMNLPGGQPEDARVVLIGNSHAQMYIPLVRPLLEERGIEGLAVPINLCLPSLGANLEGCAAPERRDVTNVSQLRSARLVIIATAWDYRVVDVRNPDGTPA